MKQKKKLGLAVSLLFVFLLLFESPLFAAGEAGDVAAAIESTWKSAAVFFFAKLAMVYFDYRKHGQFEWQGPAILFACLVFSLTAPLYIWQIVGI